MVVRQRLTESLNPFPIISKTSFYAYGMSLQLKCLLCLIKKRIKNNRNTSSVTVASQPGLHVKAELLCSSKNLFKRSTSNIEKDVNMQFIPKLSFVRSGAKAKRSVIKISYAQVTAIIQKQSLDNLHFFPLV